MPISLGSNINALRAQRQLARGADSLARVFERLSSGSRINHASDDAAGLSIASSLNADTRILTQAVRNINDGLSVLNIAQGALQELSNIVMRQKELAEQAANGSYSFKQRSAMHVEADQLTKEFNRIVQSTKFNGTTLFERNNGNTTIQVGSGSSSVISFAIGSELDRNVSAGTTTTTVNAAAGTTFGIKIGDFNGDGYNDYVTANNSTSNVSVFINNGNGTFKTAVNYATGTNPRDLVIGDFNRDGQIDIVTADRGADTITILTGNGNGTFKAGTAFTAPGDPIGLTATDLNNDGFLDIVQGNAVAGTSINVFMGNGNGTFKVATSYATGNSALNSPFVGDLTGDGVNDIVTADYASNTLSILIGNGDGSFRARSIINSAGNPTFVNGGDFNRDGYLDIVYNFAGLPNLGVRLGNGDGSFKVGTALGFYTTGYDIKVEDFNGDGYLDIYASAGSGNTWFYGNGDGTFSTGRQGGGLAYLSIGDLNNDGVPDFAVDSNTPTTAAALQNVTQVATVPYFSLYTAAEARTALDNLDQVLQRVNSELGAIGSIQSRLISANNTTQATIETYSAALSRITDVDVASESAELIRLQILQKASLAILANANLQPELTLRLLRDD